MASLVVTSLTAPIPDAATPSAPAVSVALTTDHYPQLSWPRSVDTGSAGLVGYRIIRDGVQIGTSLDPALLLYTDSTAAQGVTYGYTVVAYDAAGNEAASNDVTITVPDFTSPSVPTLSGSLTPENTASLSWTTSTDTGGSGLAGYLLYRDGGATPLVVLGPTDTSFTDSAVTPGTTYSYRILAFDGAGNQSDQSNQVTIGVPDTTPPSVPTLSGGLSPDNSVGLSWTDSTDGGSGLAGYRIYRDGQPSPYATITPDTTGYTDAGVSPGTTYTFTVTAFDNVGNESGPSNSVSVTTP